MRRFIVFLVAMLLLVATRIQAQWSDTTITNEVGKPVVIVMNISDDSLLAVRGNWTHPSIVMMCSPEFSQLIAVIWVGTPPAPGVLTNTPVFVRVAFQLDSDEISQGVWGANNEKHILFPELVHMSAFLKLMLDAHELHFGYAMPDGSFGRYTFNLDGLTQEWAKVSKLCPLVVLPSISDSSPKS